MKIIKKILVFSFLLFFFLFPIVVSAQFTADLSNSISGKLSSAGNPTGHFRLDSIGDEDYQRDFVIGGNNFFNFNNLCRYFVDDRQWQ